MTYIIEADQANKILAYLETRPYKEVAGLVALLRSLPAVKVESKVEKKKKPAKATS